MNTEGQPDLPASRRGARWRRIAGYVILAVALGALISATVVGYEIWKMLYPGTWPLYGRTPTKARPYLITGPVDITKGVPGVLELGRGRDETIAALGPPLVERISFEEAKRLGLWEYPEEGGQELLNGVFAWVDYDDNDRVEQIQFALDWASRALGAEQVVLLADGGRTCRLARTTTRDQALQVMARAWPGKKVHKQGVVEVVVAGTGLSLGFDETDHLSDVFITRLE